MKRRLRKEVIYVFSVITLLFVLYGINIIRLNNSKESEESFEFVSKSILDNEESIPVVNVDELLFRPYNDSNVTIVKNYYDYTTDEESQERSLIYYEGTYMPSSGVAYSNGDIFDVVAILDGTVANIEENNLLGNVITIDHGNGITSVYQSVGDIKVSKDDSVYSGQIIATSSTSNISTDLGNHLYFELIIDGECVNPENYFNKPIKNLKG